MKKVIPIVFAFDENLVLPAHVCITSLLINASSETFYDIFILYPQLAKLRIDELNKLPVIYNNCKITYREVDNSFDSAYEVRGITRPAYYRLLIPSIIPEYDKVLYSDVDVIFRNDLSHFYEIDIDGYYFAGVDVGIKYRPDISKYVKDVIGLDPSDGYYYSGNLLINSKKIMQDGLVEKFKIYAQNDYRFQDMDIINIVCNKYIKPLSPEFCLTNYLYFLLLRCPDAIAEYTESDLDTIFNKGIVHYNGEKPWRSICLNQDIWWQYYRISSMYNELYCSEYYDKILSTVDNWSLIKRLRHVVRYFIPRDK